MKHSYDNATQLTTFYVGENLYGIEVMSIQEVTGQLPIINVPLAPNFVRGLINLRGQIATALGLKELFGLSKPTEENSPSVFCKLEGNLVSLLVDAIGDVVETSDAHFESPPDTMPREVRKFIKGIYKVEGTLLSVIDLEKLALELSNTNDLNENKIITSP